jgi:hypothetical protein
MRWKRKGLQRAGPRLLHSMALNFLNALRFGEAQMPVWRLGLVVDFAAQKWK